MAHIFVVSLVGVSFLISCMEIISSSVSHRSSALALLVAAGKWRRFFFPLELGSLGFWQSKSMDSIASVVVSVNYVLMIGYMLFSNSTPSPLPKDQLEKW